MGGIKKRDAETICLCDVTRTAKANGKKQRKTFVLFSMAFMMWKRHRKYYIANDNGEILLQIHFRYLFGMLCIVVCVFAKNEPIISID